MSNSGKPFSTPRERGGAKGFGVTDWTRPPQQKVGKAYKRGQEFRGPYDSGDLGKDPIDRSLPQSLAANTDGE